MWIERTKVNFAWGAVRWGHLFNTETGELYKYDFQGREAVNQSAALPARLQTAKLLWRLPPAEIPHVLRDPAVVASLQQGVMVDDPSLSAHDMGSYSIRFFTSEENKATLVDVCGDTSSVNTSPERRRFVSAFLDLIVAGDPEEEQELKSVAMPCGLQRFRSYSRRSRGRQRHSSSRQRRRSSSSSSRKDSPTTEAAAAARRKRRKSRDCWVQCGEKEMDRCGTTSSPATARQRRRSSRKAWAKHGKEMGQYWAKHGQEIGDYWASRGQEIGDYWARRGQG